ncbi:hypothetical protein [Streptomyces bluensis]|uniref:hypothetical protein n=1 Tax=Streptomyces bluensis TaxID=33897 RepID=UPI003332595B
MAPSAKDASATGSRQEPSETRTFRFLALLRESVSAGAGLGEVSGQGLILAFQVLDPMDEIGLCHVVDFRAQGELDATLQGVALSFQVLDLRTGEREVGVQAGRCGPLGSRNRGCFQAVLGLVSHRVPDRGFDRRVVVDEPR